MCKDKKNNLCQKVSPRVKDFFGKIKCNNTLILEKHLVLHHAILSSITELSVKRDDLNDKFWILSQEFRILDGQVNNYARKSFFHMTLNVIFLLLLFFIVCVVIFKEIIN